jgi:hypothetical protein
VQDVNPRIRTTFHLDKSLVEETTRVNFCHSSDKFKRVGSLTCGKENIITEAKLFLELENNLRT